MTGLTFSTCIHSAQSSSLGEICTDPRLAVDSLRGTRTLWEATDIQTPGRISDRCGAERKYHKLRTVE
jgi:hypothetical protein